MNIKDAKKRIKENVCKLNDMKGHNLKFEVEETEYSIGIVNHGKVNTNDSYGAFSFCCIFDEYANKENAYSAAVKMSDLLIFGTKLLDPKSYHNFKEAA